MDALRRTGLYDLHIELGAKMVPFAGYEMPVQYPMGLMKEHLWTRENAGLFDVSHMGQVILSGSQVAAAFERMVPQDIIGLPEGRQRYAFFTNDAGGIEDDLMVANRGDHLFVVVNAACKARDIAAMRAALPGVTVREITDRALLALQGPKAESVLAKHVDVSAMRFMDVAILDSAFGPLWISRSGYAGEDGFEISVADEYAEAFARALLADDRVAPIGLGARDSLRLEAGLPLYGADLNATETPVHAGLGWAIQKVRQAGGARAGGFPGADRILTELAVGHVARAGIIGEGRAPMRAGTELFAAEEGGARVGHVTSGTFGPSVGAPVALVDLVPGYTVVDTHIWAEVRGKRYPARVVALPFRAAPYKR